MSCYNFLHPITITEGGTFNQKFQWKSGNPLSPVDITGYTSLMQIRVKLTDAAPLIDIPHAMDAWVPDGATGIYMDEPESGLYRLYINDADTLGLCAQHKDVVGIYNLFLYSPAGEAVFRQYGPAAILAACARAITP
jgi:hypothetical protein